MIVTLGGRAGLRFAKAANLPPDVEATPLRGLNLTADEATFRQLYITAVAKLQASVRGQAVLDQLGVATPDELAGELDWSGWEATLTQAQDLYAKQIAGGALGSIAEIAPGVLTLVDHSFPKAVNLAQRDAASMVGDLTATSRAAVVGAITEGLADGLSVPDVAKLLEGVVGLNARQATALERFTAINAPKMTASRLSGATARYRDALVKDRAQMIAVTEMSRAANAGRYQGYLEAALRGAIDPNTVLKGVIIAPGCCSYCAALIEPVEGLDGSFDANDPGVLYPPFHPRCRCSFRIWDSSKPRP